MAAIEWLVDRAGAEPQAFERFALMELARGRYRHFKGGEYEVIDVARDSETEQPMVVYRALYGDFGLWVRSLAMFTEIVERDGVRVRRFAPIIDSDAAPK